VTRGWRKRGVSTALIRAAIEHVGRQGGALLEAYPRLNEPGMKPPTNAAAYMGLSEVFRAAGFIEVARPANTRHVTMRYVIQR
jgi:GNAT superfamily N-acetyltransferase